METHTATISERPQLAEALIRSLFCGFRPGEKRMAVFVAYSDESGSGDARGQFLVGGYVASEQDWPYVAGAWQERVLDGPPRIPYLHMRECRNADWRQEVGVSYTE